MTFNSVQLTKAGVKTQSICVTIHTYIHAVAHSFITDGFTETEVHTVHVYPGQMFKIPVVLNGQNNGSVPGIVRAW